MRLSYNGEVPPEDSTAEESYRRFYLKNLAPVFRGDSAHLPWRRFAGYFFRSGGDPFLAWSDFAESRRWVKTNRYRFRFDASSLTDLWDNPEGDRVNFEPPPAFPGEADSGEQIPLEHGEHGEIAPSEHSQERVKV